MSHKQFVPPLGHATPDPLRTSHQNEHRSRQASARMVRKKTPADSLRPELIVLGVVWGAVAGLITLAVVTARRPARPLTWREKMTERLRHFV